MPRHTSQNRYCLVSLAGIVVGFFVGWAIFYLTPRPGPAFEAACRLYSLVFAMIGWAIGLVFRRKSIYCGGIEELDEETGRRYTFYGLLIFGLWVVATALLTTGHLYLYFCSILVVSCLIVGEVGWGKPLKVLEPIF